MKMTEIRGRARLMGAKNYGRMAKPDLIRTIQKTEGNDPCFTGIAACNQENCCWFPDCQESGVSPHSRGV